MNQSDLKRNAYMLRGSLARKGYMRWWHSFSGVQRSTGETRTFFVEILLMNPGLYASASAKKAAHITEDEPVLGQIPFYKKRGLRSSYACIKAGVFPDKNGLPGKQLQAYYPMSKLRYTTSPFIMELDDFFYSEDHIRGFLHLSEEVANYRYFMTDAGTMEWDLEVYKAVSCHSGYTAHPFAQFFHLLDSYWHAEGIKTYFRGTVTLDDEVFDVLAETSNGYADKHWGRKFNQPWFQFASGTLISERTGKELRHSALAISGCCPRFLFIPLRKKLLIQLTYTGEDFDFGFKPFVLSRCNWETKETNKRYIWHILAQNKETMIKISGSCTKEEMMQLKYESPDGILTKAPLLSGVSAIGTIHLYRRYMGARESLDTLHIKNGFCCWGASGGASGTGLLS